MRGGMLGGGGGFRGGAVGRSFRSGFAGGGFRGGFANCGYRNLGFVNRPLFAHNRFFFARNRFLFGVGFGLPFRSMGIRTIQLPTDIPITGITDLLMILMSTVISPRRTA